MKSVLMWFHARIISKHDGNCSDYPMLSIHILMQRFSHKGIFKT